MLTESLARILVGAAWLDASLVQRRRVVDALILAMRAIVDDVRAAKISVSDRRVRKAAKLARCAAALAGCTEVDASHLDCLRNVLWSKPSEALVVGEIVDKHSAAWLVEVRRLNGLVAEAEGAMGKASGDRIARMLEVNRQLGKLDEVRDALTALRAKADASNGALAEALASISLAETKARTTAQDALRSAAGVR